MLAFYLFAISFLGAENYVENIKLEECVYVLPDQIRINQNGIFVLIKDREVRTSALFRDENGLYFTDMWTAHCADGYWECMHCGHCNLLYKFWCEICYK